LTKKQKKKNNHFVPQSYLKRFRSLGERQVGLFNLKSGLTIEGASVKTQCARNYFYTKNPVYEDKFMALEGKQSALLNQMTADTRVPKRDSDDHHALLALIMFQAGRTVTAAEQQDHLANAFGKAVLQKHFEKEGLDDLLEVLPEVKITVEDGVIDAIAQHLSMYPLIGDMDMTLFVNDTDEDFVTSDHPVTLCNNLPASSPQGANTGFSSRGLIIMYPLSPRVLLFMSDPEVYKVSSDANNVCSLKSTKDVISLNLPQCFNAHENLYFASSERVKGTLAAFEKDKARLRAPRPGLVEIPAATDKGRNGVLLSMPAPARRMTLPKAVELRLAARRNKYAVGDTYIRDPLRNQVVRAELDRVQRLREAATAEADALKAAAG
jgi:hypothetical protein